jgi:hypothetical protein
MVHRIVQVALASLLTSTLAAGAAWAQDEPAGGDSGDGTTEPAGDGTTEPAAGGEAGGEAGGGGEMAPAAEAPKQLRFGVAGILAIPIGDYADGAGIGIGVSGGALYAMSPKLALAGNVGFVYHLAKNDSTVIEIPILAGVRFMVIPKLALGADTGVNIMRFSIDFAGETQSETRTRIPLGLHAGYMINDNLIAGGGLFVPNLLLTDEGEDTLMEIFAYVGYMF